MRIIHTCLRYPPAAGGAETYVRDIVEQTRHVPDPLQDDAMTDSIRDVRVLTSRLRTHGPLSELDPSLLLNDPPYVQRLHHLRTPFISYPRLQALPYYLHHHQPDIIHGYGFWYQPADSAARYAKHHHLPFIFHPIYYENDTRKKPLWQLYKRTIGRSTFAAADAVVVLSNYEKKLIENNGFPVRHFELIPPGIKTGELAQILPDPFIPHQISRPVLLSVGRLARGKGFDNAIRALPNLLKIYPHLSYIIVGEDFGDLARLTKIVSHLGLNKHVHFFGHIDRQQLIAAYQHADIFIHPSDYEAFGIVLAEAMAAHTPIIAHNAAAIPDLIKHQTTGLLFDTPSQMTSAIKEVLQNMPRAEVMAEHAQKHVRQNFDYAVTAKKIVSLYSKLTNQPV